MSVMQTFNPSFKNGIVVAPAVTTASSQLKAKTKSVCLTNLGTVTVYVCIGDSTVTATTADYPVLPSAQVTITRNENAEYVAYLAASGTGSLHVMPGEGF